MTMRRALNTLYAAIVEGMDEAERAKFDSDLEGPVLPEVDHRGRPILRRPSRPGAGATASPADLASVMGR
jgi:hypothetical protein